MARYSIQAKEIKAFFAISAAYLPFFLLATWISGHLYYLGDESLFFSSVDSIGYKAIADYYVSFGHSDRPPDDLIRVRTFLFPFYLGLYNIIGIAGVQVLQILMNTISLWLVFISIQSLSKRSWIAGLGTTLVALTPSFNFLAFHALTETLAMFLICMFTALVVEHFKHNQQAPLLLAAFVLSLLLCVRPVAIAFWILLVGYYLVCWLGDQKRRLWQPAIVMSPILCQLIVWFMTTGSPVPSAVGTASFSTWYFPVVYGAQEYGRFAGRKSVESQEGLRRFPTLKDKVRYVTENYRTAIKTYLYILIREHLTAGSSFVRTGIPVDDKNRAVLLYLQHWSVLLNRVFACVHVVMLGMMTFLVASGRSLYAEKAMLVCYIFAVLLILPAGLAYWQGDRYIVLSEPLWLVAYGNLTSLLIARWSERWSISLIRG